MGDDDELALRDESLQHFDKAIDVGFIERRIHFIEHTKRARAHHVDGKQKRHRRHRPFASAQKRDALQLFARRLGDDFDSAIQRVVLIH